MSCLRYGLPRTDGIEVGIGHDDVDAGTATLSDVKARLQLPYANGYARRANAAHSAGVLRSIAVCVRGHATMSVRPSPASRAPRSSSVILAGCAIALLAYVSIAFGLLSGAVCGTMMVGISIIAALAVFWPLLMFQPNPAYSFDFFQPAAIVGYSVILGTSIRSVYMLTADHFYTRIFLISQNYCDVAYNAIWLVAALLCMSLAYTLTFQTQRSSRAAPTARPNAIQLIVICAIGVAVGLIGALLLNSALELSLNESQYIVSEATCYG